MKIDREKIYWQEEKPVCECIWDYGKKYPVAIRCVIYETNFLGERRLKETKTFKLVEIGRDEREYEI